MPMFDIPKPWDPGYAVPAYVKNEGLQMGTYTTRWAPRGSYDNPDALDPSWDKSYAQPAYVMKEGYGQGAKVTHWPPRGTYAGAVPGRVKQQVVRALGDSDAPLPAAYDRYGKRAAKAIMLRLQAVSPAQRKTELKKLLDAIDPGLWSRTESIASKLTARGVPAGKALYAALARAMGVGIAGEILELGTSKTLPKTRSLLGLGGYGCAGVLGALGETVAPKAGGGFLSTVTTITAPILGSASSSCTNPPPGFTWDQGGFWRRLAVNEVPAPNPGGGCYAIDARTGQPAMTQAPTTPTLNLLRVGPWIMPNKPDEGKLSISKSLLTTEQMTMLAKGLGKSAAGMIAAGSYGTLTKLEDALPGWGFKGLIPSKALQSFFPIAKFTHPETHDTKAVWVRFLPTLPGQTPQLQISWGDPKKTLWETIVGFLVDLIASIVKPVLEELGNLACQLVNDPAAAAGTSIAGGAAGAGAGAAAGVAAAQQFCGGGTPAPAAPDSFPIIPVVIAGGAVIALAAFWPKKKRTP